MKVVSALPQLTKLDFYNQLLTGTLPSNISFPKLSEMRLIANDISVRLSHSPSRLTLIPKHPSLLPCSRLPSMKDFKTLLWRF